MDDQERADARREQARHDAVLVERARGDDPGAFGELYERWFDRVHDLAYRITRDASLAGEAAQDAFVAAWQGLGGLQDPAVFGGWLLRITRNTALNRRRKEQRSTPRDAEGMAMIEAARGSRADAPAGFRVEDRVGQAEDPARAVEDAELVALVRESADALGERDAEVLDLTLRHGLTPAEVGEVIGVNRNAANQAVHKVRGRLRTAVEARVLWRGGEPVCGDLADVLTAADVTRFGAEAVRVASAHADGCEQCSRRRSTKLEPTALFAATPFLAVPLLKAEVARALSDAGVPMGDAPSRLSDASSRISDASSAPGRGRRRQRRWVRRTLVGAAGLVLTLLAVGLLAEELDDGTVVRSALRASTSTVPVGVSVAPPAEVGAPTTVPRPTAPPVLPPAPPVDGALSVSPAAVSTPTFARPTVSWSTANASAVEVSGPGLASGAPSGAVAVCPGVPSGPGCSAPPGVYTYTLRAYDANGALVLESSSTFSVG